jgi:hypothetical protein
MRHLLALASLLWVAGCTGAHSNGGLWALQNLEQEGALFRLSDAQRADQARAFEFGLADETLASERARIEAGLRGCPGPSREPLALSPGDRVRDTVRVQAADDAVRLAAVAQIALADWRMRRAWATGESRFCDLARAALATPPPSSEPGQGLLEQLGLAAVARGPGATEEALPGDDSLISLSLYASGWTDVVRARSPLPQYLAAVYGGQVVDRPPLADLGGRSVEEVVDDLAPSYPEWEPDALYVALKAG